MMDKDFMYNMKAVRGSDNAQEINQKIYDQLESKAKSQIQQLDSAGYFNGAKNMYAPSLVLENIAHIYEQD